MMDHEDLLRIADTLDALPKTWQNPHDRAHLFHALSCALTLPVADPARIASWEAVRYLAGFPTGTGLRIPIYAALSGPGSRDPYVDGEPPEFGELMAVLNRAAGWES